MLGRVQAGVCYHVYTKEQHTAMVEHDLPELLRTLPPGRCSARPACPPARHIWTGSR